MKNNYTQQLSVRVAGTAQHERWVDVTDDRIDTLWGMV